MFIFVIKNLREKKNITSYQLAKMTKISRSYLLELENNKKYNPSLLMLSRISKALDVSIKDLFYEDLEIDSLKKEMYERIDKYGLNSAEALEVSQIIDLLINIDMNKQK